MTIKLIKIVAIFFISILVLFLAINVVKASSNHKTQISKNKKELRISTTKSLYNLMNVLPGATSTGCVTISYKGKKPKNINLYINKKILDNNIKLTINQGYYKKKKKKKIRIPKTTSCKNFKKKKTIFNNELSFFSKKYSKKKPLKLRTIKKKKKWKNNDQVTYQFIVRVKDQAKPGLKLPSHRFIWGAK